MSVDDDVDAGPDRQIACPTNIDRVPKKFDVDDPRVSADKLYFHCFPEDEIRDDGEYLLQPVFHQNDVHLPKSYAGELTFTLD